MYTFTQLLRAEINNDNTEIMQQRNNQQRFVALNTEIKKIMRNLDLAQNPDPTNDRSYTFFDIFQALDVAHDVIADRLSGTPDEYKNDENRNYSSLWTSIEEEVREATKTLFTVRSNNKKSSLFIHDFNRLVVTRLIQALSLIGPDQARKALPVIINSTKTYVINTTEQYTDSVRDQAIQDLRGYSRDGQKKDKNKKLSKADRLRLIHEAVLRLTNQSI